ncbi:hypothetical protein ATANTOWER_018742 [Ataeniobius toweri]|uniref:Uncharacterized protein n=1 Tax=Ataeniobius toweri TaxID=208326 RepID=A0ABU7BUE3_9TELE|nr:hypothetical protein [Ataeniobius toweri]
MVKYFHKTFLNIGERLLRRAKELYNCKGLSFMDWECVLPVHTWVLSCFLPQSKNMTFRLIGLSQLPLGVHGCLSCVSELPCDGMATCPGCTPPLAHRSLKISTSSRKKRA